MRMLLCLPVVAVAILCVSCSTPSYNLGSEDPYRLGDSMLRAISIHENKAVKQLMISGAPLNCRDRKDDWTPLIYAIYYENWTVARMLLAANVDINAVDKENRSALIWAAIRGDLTTLRMLVERGASINIMDRYGMNALAYAAFYNHGAAAKYLAEVGRVPSRKQVTTEKKPEVAPPAEKNPEPASTPPPTPTPSSGKAEAK